MEYNIIIKRKPSKSEKQGIYDILNMCDNDFVPPLSFRGSFKDNYFYTSNKRKTVYNYYQSLINSNAIYVIACDKLDNKIIGLSVLQDDENNLYLSTICVQLKYRNQGVCKKLLSAIIDYAYSNKYTNIHTRTWSTNIIQKIILENMGFEFVNTEKEFRRKGIYSVYYNLSL